MSFIHHPKKGGLFQFLYQRKCLFLGAKPSKQPFGAKTAVGFAHENPAFAVHWSHIQLGCEMWVAAAVLLSLWTSATPDVPLPPGVAVTSALLLDFPCFCGCLGAGGVVRWCGRVEIFIRHCHAHLCKLSA